MKLLASAALLPDIQDLIARFYGGERKHMILMAPNEWRLERKEGLIPGVRVVLKRGRYRFEAID